MTYHQCEKCQFWITIQDKYCPNCNEPNRKQLTKFPLILSFFYWTSSFFLLFRVTWFHTWSRAIPFAIMTGILGGGVLLGFSKLIEKLSGVANIWALKPASCLIQDEQTIRQRVKDLAGRERPMHGIQQRARQIRDPQQRQKIENSLDSAIAALHAQRDRYKAKLWEIQLIRWHNALKPLLATWKVRTKSQYEHLYKELNAVRRQGEMLLLAWKDDVSAPTPEGQRNISRLQAALVSCDQMYQDLVAHQAVEAIKDVSRFEKVSRPGYETTAALEQIETDQMFPDIEAFSSGLTDLETEYFRLKSEEEIEQEMGL